MFISLKSIYLPVNNIDNHFTYQKYTLHQEKRTTPSLSLHPAPRPLSGASRILMPIVNRYRIDIKRRKIKN